MNTVELNIPQLKPRDQLSIRRLWHSLPSNDLAMDLGTANTLIYLRNRGIVVSEPSVVAVNTETGKPIAVGREAKEMVGRTPRGITCVRPMKDGVIADFEMTAVMIRLLLQRASRWLRISKPRIVIGVPSGITQVEKRAVVDAALCSGMRRVMLTEETMAAALGAGLPVNRPVGNMVVDIGGGTTEIAILSVNQTLYSRSVRVAGDEMDLAIQRHIRRMRGIEVGLLEAERIKLMVGSALVSGEERSIFAYGRDLSSGMPRKLRVSEGSVREALTETVEAIVAAVVVALEQISAELAQDIVARGIFLAGGGSLLRGLPERLQRETGIQFVLAQDPLSCVVRGVGKIVDNLKDLRVLCIS